MRIGLVVPGFSANAADWCIPALRDLVGHLATTDDVRVLALRYPHRASRYEVFGAQVTALGGGRRRRARAAVVWGNALLVLAQEHRRRPFDVLHAFWATESGTLTAIAGRVLGVPTVVSLAGGELVALRDIAYGDQLVTAERLKIALALRLARDVTAGSQYLLDVAAPWLRLRPVDRVHRVPLGVDLHRFQPTVTTPADDSPRIVHVASLVPVKDQATLLRAAAGLRDRGLRFSLQIAGAGRLEPELRSLAMDLGIDRLIHFHGEIPHGELPGFYQRGDLFVLSSRHEAQSLAVLEAAACAVPSVGTAVGIVPELAPAAALAVPPRDPAALTDALAHALSDSPRRRELGTAARWRVEAEFSVERSAERFRRLYHAAIVASGCVNGAGG
ncbi:MAG TPA: glycosyltransferase [Chloroflexota bacterium]|nr:glycosyltransferase [Chloroflexota bacterium]